jgi:gamma-polyglutamate biosynthesis protein CapA
MKRKLIIAAIAAIVAILTLKGYWVARSAKISIVGDVLLDRGVKEMVHLHRDNQGYPYEGVSGILKDSDLTIGNLEGPITNSGAPVLKKGNLIFRGNPLCIPYLYNAGFRVFNLANNHSMDYGAKGMSESIRLLNNGGISTFGGGLNKEAAEKPKYMNINGIKIGLLGFSAFPPEGYFCFEDRPDVAHLEENRLYGMIKAAKKNCDILIVMFHWGEEFSYYASEHQKTVAHLACDSGADIVIGHHPHVLQGVEKYKGKYIFYSLGNFIFDRQIPSGTDETGILQLLIDKNKIQKSSLLPIKIVNCRPRTCNLEEARHIYERFVLYSKGMGAVIDYKETSFNIN